MSRPIRVGVGDDVRDLCPGDSHTFALAPQPAVARN
jgi:hypothetical protein